MIKILNRVWNIQLVIKEAIEGEKSIFFQTMAIFLFYIYERGLLLFLLKTENNIEPYFIHSKLISNLILAVGIACVAMFLKRKKVFGIVDIYFNSFIACQLWTWVIFSLYLAVTIPLDFFLVENLYGSFRTFFSSIGYVIFNCFPFILLIYSINKVLKNDRSKQV